MKFNLETRKREEGMKENNFQEIKTSQDDERNQFLISFPDPCAECSLIVVVLWVYVTIRHRNESIRGNKTIAFYNLDKQFQYVSRYHEVIFTSRLILAIRSRVWLVFGLINQLLLSGSLSEARDWLWLKKRAQIVINKVIRFSPTSILKYISQKLFTKR